MAAQTPTALPDRGILESVNVGSPRPIIHRGREEMTSIWKSPAPGRVAVRGVNVVGDVQSNLSVHGGPDKAVYAYGCADFEWWAGELGRSLEPGAFGENLTVRGIAVSEAVVGERWRVGTVVLEVAQPRIPCFKLGIRMGDPRFVKRFARAHRPGAYLRIVQEGELAAGDVVEVIHRPGHGVTVADAARAQMGDRAALARLPAAPELPQRWQEWAREQLAGKGRDSTGL